MPSHTQLLFRKPPSWLAYVVSLALLVTIGATDWVTGQLTFSLFYLVPVGVAAWFAGRRAGYLFAALGALAWLIAEVEGGPIYSSHAITYWNAGVRCLMFVAVAFVISAWKVIGERLEAAVEERTAALKAEISERQQAQGALQKVSAQLADAEGAERRRIAYDIHDALGQMLSVVKLNLEGLAAEASGDGSRQSRLADLVRIVEGLIKQTRTLTFDLHPAMLDDLGLVPTLEWYADDLSRRTGTEILVSQVGEGRPLSGPQSNYLFRSIKELLNNAVRHGKASEIVITVHWEPAALRVVIDDNGGGFEPAAISESPAQRGLGLAGIRERLRWLGGDMKLESEIAEGARVILSVPVAESGEPSLR